MSSLFGVEELYEQTVARLVVLGSELDHAFGAKHVGRMALPNSYVWVPTTSRENKKSQPRGGLNYNRTNFGTEEHFEIHCWGESHEAAIVMRSDVVHAMRYALQGIAPLHYDTSEWLVSAEDETTLGNVLVCRFWLDSVMADEYVGVARFVRSTEQALTAAAIASTEATSVEVKTYKSEATTADGNLMDTDEVTL